MKKNKQSAKLRHAIALAVGLGINQLAWAVGLGPINVTSYLGQPLSATIRIDGLTPQTAERTVVRLAGAEAYKARGVQMQESHQRLAFKVQPAGDGFVIKVTSNGQMSESFLNFLVTLNGDGGVITREYSVFLEPNPAGSVSEAVANAAPAQSASPAPEAKPAKGKKGAAAQSAQPAQPAVQLQPAEAAAPVAQTQAVAVPVRARGAQSAAPVEAYVAPQAAYVAPQPAVASGDYPPPANPAALAAARTPAERAAALVSRPVDGVYGPVKQGETLYSIANALRPEGVSVQQMLNALYTHNRKAFSGRSYNSLIVGAKLVIPNVSPSGHVQSVPAQPQSALSAPPKSGKAQPARSEEKRSETPAAKVEPKEVAPVLETSEGKVTVYRANGKHGAVVHVALGEAAEWVMPVTPTAEAKPAEAPAEPVVEVKVEEKPAETPAEPVVEVKVEEKPAEAPAEPVVEVKVEEKPAETPAEPVVEVKVEEKPAEAPAEPVVEVTVNEKAADGSPVIELKVAEPPAAPAVEMSVNQGGLQLDSASSVEELKPAETPAEPVVEVKAEEQPAETVAEPVVEVKVEDKPAEPVAEVKVEEKPAEPAPVETPKPVEPPKPVEAPKPAAPAPAPAPVVEEDEGMPLAFIAAGGALGLLGLGGLTWFLLNRRRAKPYQGEEILEDLSSEELEEMERSLGDLGDDDVNLNDLSFENLQQSALDDEDTDLDNDFSDLSFDKLSEQQAESEQDDDLLNDLLSDQLGDDFFNMEEEPASAPLSFGQSESLFGDIDVELDDDSESSFAHAQDELLIFGDDKSAAKAAPAPVEEWDFDDISLGEPEIHAEPASVEEVSLEEPVVLAAAEPQSALVEDEDFISFEPTAPSFIQTDSDVFVDNSAAELLAEPDDEAFVDFNVKDSSPVASSDLDADFVEVEDGGVELGFSSEEYFPAAEEVAPVFVDDNSLSSGLSLTGAGANTDFFEAENEATSMVAEADLFGVEEAPVGVSLSKQEAVTPVVDDGFMAEIPTFAEEKPAPVVKKEAAPKVEAMAQDMSINLELAHSFIATGRPERARTWLNEVVELGTDEQKAEALKLLEQLG